MTGEELKEWREREGLTQEELADKLTVARNTVTRWENDTRAIPAYLYLALKTLEKKKPARAS